jgi:hypothetical protein
MQDKLATAHMALAVLPQDQECHAQQVAQIAQRDGVWLEEERQKVRELEEELQRLRIEAEAARRGQMSEMQTKCEEARLASETNHNSIVSHFKDLTARIDAHLQEEAIQRQVITERLNSKEQKRVEKENRWAALENMFRKVVDDEAAERLRAQKQREEEALRPGDFICVYLKS